MSHAPGHATLATTGLQGLAGAVQIAGSIALGIAQIEQGKGTKKLLDQEARQVELIGLLNARKRRTEGQRLLGAQVAGFGKSNLAQNFGSALDIQLRTRALEELAALEEQLPFRIRASDLRRQGKLAKQGAAGTAIRTISRGVARAIEGLPVGVSDPDTPEAETILVPKDYRDLAPVVPEGQILASLQGNRISAGDMTIMDLAPLPETLGVGGTA